MYEADDLLEKVRIERREVSSIDTNRAGIVDYTRTGQDLLFLSDTVLEAY